MLLTQCIPCQNGHHEKHIEILGIPPKGMIGGSKCPCKGECKFSPSRIDNSIGKDKSLARALGLAESLITASDNLRVEGVREIGREIADIILTCDPIKIDKLNNSKKNLGAFIALIDALKSKKPLVWNGDVLVVFDCDVPDSDLWKAQATMVLDQDDFSVLEKMI